MKKSTKFIAGITAAVLTLGIVGCSKDSGITYPNFINSEAYPVVDETSEKYTVNVLSEGGLQLDGVRITVKKNGEILKRVLSSDGKAEISIPLGEYDLEVDESTLPAGYHLTETKYKTNPNTREEITIKIPSKLLSATESCGFRVGDIMRDFTFKDYSGESHKLSEVLSTKKAVFLNFWYINCPNCDAEFPAIQRAYSSRSDIEIFAINPIDNTADGASYQSDKGLTFPMGEDRANMSSSFNVEGYPTTVVIDRYGLIAASHSGGQPDMSYWVNLFNIYTAPDYTQYLVKGGEGEGPQLSRPELIKPDVTMPNTTAIEAAANGDGFKATYRADTNEYVWPWLVGEDENGNGYIYSSNAGKGSTYSIIYADFEMKAGDVLAFDYLVDSEAGRDVLLVMIDGILVNGGDGWSATEDWQTAYVYVADEDATVELALTFSKDAADPENFNKKDMAMVRDIRITDQSVFTENPIDVMRPAARGANPSANKYDSYVTVTDTACSDGFYHVGDENGPLLFMSVSNLTPWSDMHSGSYHQDEDRSYYNTLYNMTYYNYGTYIDERFHVIIGDEAVAANDITDTVITNWTIQMYMDEPYYLVPVTEDLKDWAVKFANEYEKNLGLSTHDKEWIEFCYYYNHYGSDNYDHGVDAKGNEKHCTAVYDRTKGLSRQNCYEAYESDSPLLSSAETYNEKTGRLIAEMNFPMQPPNGVYFKFTPSKSGVYEIRSYTGDYATANASPNLYIYDADGRMLSIAGDVRNHDAKKGVNAQGQYDEVGFIHYYTAEAGETVYLLVATTPATTAYYEFTINYIAPTYQTMYIASTAGGMWGGANGEDYAAIPVVLDRDTNCYYKRDANGNPISDQPIYIDFVFESCMYAEIPGCTFKPLSWLIENRYFADLDGGEALQAGMEYYLAQSTTGKTPDDETYGLVEADASIVEALNKFMDRYIYGGRGKGNGWLMFGCYMEKFGE